MKPQYKGIFRLYPSQTQADAMGESALVAIVEYHEGGGQQLAFVRGEDIENHEDFEAHLMQEPLLAEKDEDPDRFPFALEDPLEPMTPEEYRLATAKADALAELESASIAVERGVNKPSDFPFWGDKLKSHYATVRRRVAAGLLRAAKAPVGSLEPHFVQSDIMAYGLTAGAVLDSLREASVPKNVPSQASALAVKLRYCEPKDEDQPKPVQANGAAALLANALRCLLTL